MTGIIAAARRLCTDRPTRVISPITASLMLGVGGPNA